MAATSVKSRHSRTKISSNRENRRKPEVEELPSYLQPWTPSAYTAFKALLSARLCAAIWSNISDCDETFNYWEPLHYILHGSGFQTWEYSPDYAIRSYAYIWLYAAPIKLYTGILQANKILQFYFLRCLLSFCCCVCEVYFYRSICKQFGANTGRVTLCFMLFSTGMFISCSAFLPSSFAMYMTLVSMAGWYLGHYPVAILGTAASAIIGWPFAGALGIPIAWDLLITHRRIWTFTKWSFLSLLLFLVPLVWIDSHYYGGIVIAPVNIVLYNVFSQHGPDIYGVEPWSFYFMNGFLNFNIAFIMALVSMPFALLIKFILKQPTRGLPIWLGLGPLYIWIAIFFTRPHKEERFLFPVYPLICLAAAVFMDHTQKLFSYLFAGRSSGHYTDSSNWLAGICALTFTLISVSRSVALYQGYHAPLDVYVELNKVAGDSKIHTLPSGKDVNVCVGKEWYRFPSSFFLPDDKWHLQFIKSEFKGQLPKPYDSGPHATRSIPTHMNDMNGEEPTRYINITRCHYLIDLDVPRETEYEPRYSLKTKEWKVVASGRFLDTFRSHKLFRAFYIPFVSSQYVTFIDYNVLKTTRTRRTGKS